MRKSYILLCTMMLSGQVFSQHKDWEDEQVIGFN